MRARAIRRYLDEWQRGSLAETERMGFAYGLFGMSPAVEQVDAGLQADLVQMVLRASADLAPIVAEALEKLALPIEQNQLEAIAAEFSRR